VKRIFVTGISTDVGKTIISAIIAEALEADYWKPVQAGNLDDTDTIRVKNLISNTNSRFHKSTFLLKSPMSPHAAADIDGVSIGVESIREPLTSNNLVIEGAGGLLVPLNDDETVIDLILPHYKVVLVSRHYLGSINHTLLTIECLRSRGIEPAVLFSGSATPYTEQVIHKMTGVMILGRIDEEQVFNKKVILRYARQLSDSLNTL
jgi:dethiobiotin synthetase